MQMVQTVSMGPNLRLEIDDGTEIWSFEAVNGYADAPPLAIDTDDDDIIDGVCWVTWYRETTARHGRTGCHDVRE